MSDLGGNTEIQFFTKLLPGNQNQNEYFLKKRTESTGKSLSEPLIFAEHGENMLCTIIALNVRNNFCTHHILPRFELENFM